MHRLRSLVFIVFAAVSCSSPTVSSTSTDLSTKNTVSCTCLCPKTPSQTAVQCSCICPTVTSPADAAAPVADAQAPKPIDAAPLPPPVDAAPKPVDAAPKVVDAAPAPPPVDAAPKPVDAAPLPVDSSVPPSTIAIGEWTDSPGTCPVGTRRVDITTTAQLKAATQGTGAYASDGPNTCYFIRNGSYIYGTDGVLRTLVEMNHGGTTNQPIYLIGESRSGTSLHGINWVNPGANHIVIRNMTFDIGNYTGPYSMSNMTISGVTDFTIDHVTFTGDCKTGGVGGHIDMIDSHDVTITASVFENFGKCFTTGSRDHGIYLESGSNIIVTNNIVRGNSARGIQLYSDASSLQNVTIERNKIYGNGHRDYEDGMVIDDTVTGLVVRRNLFWDNYYSGIRFASNRLMGVQIYQNTFYGDGVRSTNVQRSEINVDQYGQGVNNVYVSSNIFAASPKLVNDCSLAGSPFSVADNVVSPGTTTAGSCVANVVSLDPQFVNAPSDLHTRAAGATGYGAYAQ